MLTQQDFSNVEV